VLRRLEQAGLRPRRRLGQHFLVDPSILARIAAAADLGSGDTVLEVGTGPGTLTRHLCAAARQVISIELDERMLEFARGELAGQANLELLCGDVLERKSAVSRSVLQRLAAHASAKVVANLPYSVATPFLVGLFEQAPQVTLAVVLVQREVALRLVAAPGGGAYGPPTLLLGYWARASMLWDVPAGAFVPPPRVTSTLVRLARRDAPLGSREAYPAYAAWVRRLFSQRRKQLGGSLRRRLGPVAAEQALERLGVDGATRVESLPAGAFLRLAREFGAPG
jgi:16S rRNA (adenine1518-N6/adenine1519-N6)-dimethyltransferase